MNALRSDYYLVGLTASANLDPNFGTGGFAPSAGELADRFTARDA